MQHLDRRLEHLDEFENALIGAVEPARIAVGIGIVLGVGFQLANVDLADQRRDVLIVLVSRLGFGNRDLAQPRRLYPDDAEAGNIAAEVVEPLQAPWAHQPVQRRSGMPYCSWSSEPMSQDRTGERAFEHGTDLVARFQDVDRMNLHQLLQPLRERRLAAADGTEQIENLLALFEPRAACRKKETMRSMVSSMP